MVASPEAHARARGTTRWGMRRALRPVASVCEAMRSDAIRCDAMRCGYSRCTHYWVLRVQYCTQMVQPFASGLGADMFYPPSPWNVTATIQSCLEQFNVRCRPDWPNVGFPGSRLDDGRFSKIVFTNGYLDPWSGGGVLANISTVHDVLAYVLPNGAHHLDLMWSHENDPPDAVEARAFIAAAVRRWVGQ